MISLKTVIKIEESGFKLIEILRREDELYLCIEKEDDNNIVIFGITFRYLNNKITYEIHIKNPVSENIANEIIDIIKSEKEHRLHVVCTADYIKEIKKP